ncbi:hypothetical protein ACE1B6_12885 [Aerosakkonemataceae cyanobacterium BLCC-F154]|uniref:Peptidase C-terminal archaeal/bacterial domain-containing protein n=1 Tax=Floridaenema fluviatile BLCC-F154 TaxID=3153640 RepID=A0ABV4YBE0_9CYAN
MVIVGKKLQKRYLAKLGVYLGCCLLGFGLTILSNPLFFPDGFAQALIPKQTNNQLLIAQSQLPSPAKISRSTRLQCDKTIQGRLSTSDFRFQGRRFQKYLFNGQKDQLIRVSLVGGSPTQTRADTLQVNQLLINPVVVLYAPNGQMVEQQPKQANSINAVIRTKLPTTGTYNLLVTSATPGAVGRFNLTYQQLKPDGTNASVCPA